MRLICLAVLATFGVAPAASAAAPVTAVPTEGTGTTSSAGTWSSSVPYTATMANTFTPSRIKPGEPFTYHSVMRVFDDVDFGGQPGGTYQSPDSLWPFTRVQRGGNLWESALGGRQLRGDNTVTYADTSQVDTTTVIHEVDGARTAGMPPGCYQSTNINSEFWFGHENVDATTGTIGTLIVYDEVNEVWPSCSTCETGLPDDDGDGFTGHLRRPRVRGLRERDRRLRRSSRATSSWTAAT